MRLSLVDTKIRQIFQQRGALLDKKLLTSIVLTITAIGILVSCASMIPVPGPPDVTHASLRWPRIKLEDLQVGKKLYIANCAGCHDLHAPSEKTPDEWEEVMIRMQPKANIDDKTKDSILAYLEALTTKQ